MTIALKDKKPLKPTSGESEADRLARTMGGRPFKMAEAVVDAQFSDREMEEFLRWREERRNSEMEATRNWQE